MTGKVKGKFEAHENFLEVVATGLFVELGRQHFSGEDNPLEESKVEGIQAEARLAYVLLHLAEVLKLHGIVPFGYDGLIDITQLSTCSEDFSYNYFVNLAVWLMQLLHMKDTVKEGDTERLMLNCKAVVPFFYSHSKLSKYFIENVDFVTKVNFLLSPLQRLRTLEGAFVNTSGERGKNIETDLAQENEVRRRKDLIKLLGANKTETSILRITNASTSLNEVATNFDNSLSVPKGSSWHTRRSRDEDFQSAITTFSQVEPFKHMPCRKPASGLPKMPISLLQKIDKVAFSAAIVRSANKALLGNVEQSDFNE